MSEQPSFTIRPASPVDAAAIGALCIQLGYDNTLSPIRSRLERLEGQTDHRILVAVVERQIVGMVHGMLKPMLIVDEYVEINALIVDAAQRGQGIGRALMKQIEGWARDQGCRAVRFRSNIIREEAHHFYQDLGYRINKTQYAFHKEL